MWNKLNQNGQSLIEMVIVIAVGVLVASALVFATIASLRNSQFAKNQSIATKLAQEGLEAVRNIRDRNIEDECVYTRFVGGILVSTSRFSELYDIDFVLEPGEVGQMKFRDERLVTSGLVTSGSDFQSIPDSIFSRQVQITNSNGLDYRKEKLVTVIVKWSDFSGEHQSKLSTILTKK